MTTFMQDKGFQCRDCNPNITDSKDFKPVDNNLPCDKCGSKKAAERIEFEQVIEVDNEPEFEVY